MAKDETIWLPGQNKKEVTAAPPEPGAMLMDGFRDCMANIAGPDWENVLDEMIRNIAFTVFIAATSRAAEATLRAFQVLGPKEAVGMCRALVEDARVLTQMAEESEEEGELV